MIVRYCVSSWWVIVLSKVSMQHLCLQLRQREWASSFIAMAQLRKSKKGCFEQTCLLEAHFWNYYIVTETG